MVHGGGPSRAVAIPRALIAADDGPLVGELKAFGGEWIPLVNATVNPFKLRSGARMLERLIASERIDIVHAQSVGGAWSANMAAAQIAVWLVTTLPDVPAVSGLRAYWAAALARGDRVITPSNFAAAPVMARYDLPRERLTSFAQHRHRRVRSGSGEPERVGRCAGLGNPRTRASCWCRGGLPWNGQLTRRHRPHAARRRRRLSSCSPASTAPIASMPGSSPRRPRPKGCKA